MNLLPTPSDLTKWNTFTSWVAKAGPLTWPSCSLSSQHPKPSEGRTRPAGRQRRTRNRVNRKQSQCASRSPEGAGWWRSSGPLRGWGGCLSQGLQPCCSHRVRACESPGQFDSRKGRTISESCIACIRVKDIRNGASPDKMQRQKFSFRWS